jgi:ribosomal-protein-alanine N-acetyltransferase
MIRRDMPEVLEIEHASFEFAWTEEEFLRCLRQRNCIGMVAEQGEKVVGFMIYELCRRRLELLNFAVLPSHRRSRIGTAMVNKLISKLSSHRRNRIATLVRERNLAAQYFFRRQGFLATELVRGAYDDSGEDGYRMEWDLPEEPEEREFPVVEDFA